jgi:hypothetical protein
VISVAAERRAQLQAVFLKARVSAPLPLNLKAIKRDGYLGHRAWDLAPLS